MTKFPPAIRRNWGYWDGKSARQRGRFPEWCKSWNAGGRHPFDKPYGEGFWLGWYDMEPPEGAVITVTKREV